MVEFCEGKSQAVKRKQTINRYTVPGIPGIPLLLTYIIWGAVAVFIGLFIAGVGVVPIAMLATAIKGEWAITGQIVLLLVLTFGSRMLGFYFAQRADELAYESSYEEE